PNALPVAASLHVLAKLLTAAVCVVNGSHQDRRIRVVRAGDGDISKPEKPQPKWLAKFVVTNTVKFEFLGSASHNPLDDFYALGSHLIRPGARNDPTHNKNNHRYP